MHQCKDSLFCVANPLGSYLWKHSGLQNLITKCVALDTDHCASGSHWRQATRLVFGGQSDRSDVTESKDFEASAKGTHICSCTAV